MPTVRTALAAAATLAAGLALTASSCTGPQAHACATAAPPPVAVDPAQCTAPLGDDSVTGGVRWYTAPEDDVADDDEQPVPGRVLDGDWYSAWDRADLDDHHRATFTPTATAKPKPSKAPTTTTRKPSH